MKTKTPNNFGGLPAEFSSYKNSKIAVLPVPFDRTSSWIKGADKGPDAIINASKNMELYDIETGYEVYKQGIYTSGKVISGTSAAMNRSVQEKVKDFLAQGKFIVVIGGEHSVSLGTIKAHADKYEGMSILHLDAHSDRRDSYEGNKFSHASIIARAGECVGNIISVGIRSMDASELENIDREKMFFASDIRRKKDWIRRVVSKLSRNVYITIDIDVFDPSIMPSTGTPEPGGMGWYEVLDLLESVSKKKNIVGFDVVELCPSKNDPAPDFLAAKLIYKLLSFRFTSK